MLSSLKNRKGTFLPDEFNLSHELCFLLHDVIAEVIRAGAEDGIFVHEIKIEDTVEADIESTEDIFNYLDENKRYEDRTKILIASILPALLSDMIHCIYETLETSRKGKLNISYMLIRKPIQENLYVLESMLLNEVDFANNIVDNPHKLESKNAGGVDGHTKRINNILSILNLGTSLNAKYIADLRYNKKSNDSFDGICNKAMHLFTSHDAIRTEKFNINFIFSNDDSKILQWKFLYSRLPYLLFYLHKIVENILTTFVQTSEEYLEDVRIQVNGLIILWWDSLEEEYQADEMEDFIVNINADVKEYFFLRGNSNFTRDDVMKLAKIS